MAPSTKAEVKVVRRTLRASLGNECVFFTPDRSHRQSSDESRDSTYVWSVATADCLFTYQQRVAIFLFYIFMNRLRFYAAFTPHCAKAIAEPQFQTSGFPKPPPTLDRTPENPGTKPTQPRPSTQLSRMRYRA